MIRAMLAIFSANAFAIMLVWWIAVGSAPGKGILMPAALICLLISTIIALALRRILQTVETTHPLSTR